MAYIIQLIASVRNTRQSLNIAWSNEVTLILNTSNKFEKTAIESAKEFLRTVTKAKEILLDKEAEQPANTVIIGDTRLSIPLAGLVDFDKLQSSISTKISKLEKDIEVLGKRLSSENFVNNASPEKVEETRGELAAMQEQKTIFETELMSFS